MKITRTLKTDENKLYHFIHHLANEDAGKTVETGTTYKKMLTTMKGAKQKVKVTVDAMEHGQYHVTIDQDGNLYRMNYDWTPDGDNKVSLVYEETVEMKDTKGKLNQKLSSLLMGRSVRNRVNTRLDAFEKALEDFTWQD